MASHRLTVEAFRNFIFQQEVDTKLLNELFKPDPKYLEKMKEQKRIRVALGFEESDDSSDSNHFQ